MEMNFTPEQQAAMRPRDQDDHDLAAIDLRIAQADRGELIDDNDVRLWLEERERPA